MSATRRWLRFSVGSLLLLILIMALTLSAYRVGQQHGFDSGFEAGEWAERSNQVVTRIYDLGAGKDVDDLKDEIKETEVRIPDEHRWLLHGENSKTLRFRCW